MIIASDGLWDVCEDQQAIELYSVSDDFIVGSLRITDDPGPTLRSLRGIDEALPSLSVLGVRHSAGYLGRPPVDIELHAGHEIIVYGRRGDLAQLENSG